MYAATKKSNELMAHSYSSLYSIPTTGLRFFTVYGPWGRPDMALFKFAEAIMKNEKIFLYNHGKHKRDFTYVDDIVEGILATHDNPPKKDDQWDATKPDPGTSFAPWRVYNIGNNNPVDLMEYVRILEIELGKEARKEFLPLQPGDVPNTFANIDHLVKDTGYSPSTSVEEGIRKFAVWYKRFLLLMKIIILAAGQGSRMGVISKEIPKPLMPIGDSNVICRLIFQLLKRNKNDISIVVGYKSNQIKETITKAFPNADINFIQNNAYKTDTNIYSVYLATVKLKRFV